MYNHASDGAVTTTVSALSDDRLLERTKELSRIEHHLEVVVIDHLREIHKRRLYLRRGFSSLFDYAVRELGYSDAAAWRRIKAMRLCADVEGVRERLQNGSMTLNAAAQLQHAFDRQERKKERAARSAPRGAGFRAQDGAAPPRPAERKPAAAPPPALDAEARRELVEQASGKSSREVMQMLAEVDPELAASADRVRPLGGGRWELKAAIDDECRRGLERLKGLLSHVDPHLTMGQLMGRLVREGLDRHDPARPPRGRRAARRPKAPSRLRRRRRRRRRFAALPRQRSRRRARTAPLLRRRRCRLRRRRSRETKPLTARTLRQRSRRATPLRRRRRGASAGRLRWRAWRGLRRRRGPKLRQRRRAGRPAAPSRRRSSARCGGATGAAAATWTAPAGAAAAPNTCCRSIT